MIKYLIDELMRVNQIAIAIPEAIDEQEKLVAYLMTISPPHPLSETYYQAEADYLKAKQRLRPLVTSADMTEQLFTDIYLFKGDITTIQTDAIVNAANEKLLGCFIPGHHCIDNAIHLSAGLALRNACNELMERQGHDEPVGRAKITLGYNLPANYVVHTVGPNRHLAQFQTKEAIKQGLVSCYQAVLHAVAAHADISELVFCSISTGIYGVPIAFASEIALQTINDFLHTKDHHLNKVIINVFSEEDFDAYKQSCQRLSSGNLS